MKATALLKLSQFAPAHSELDSLEPFDSLRTADAARAWCVRGRLAQAQGRQTRALSCYEHSMRFREVSSAHSAGLAAYLLNDANETLEALAKADSALEVARLHGQADWTGEMLLLKARILAGLGRHHDASACLAEVDRMVAGGSLRTDTAAYLKARSSAETAVRRFQPGLSTAVEALGASDGSGAAAFAAATAAWHSGQLAVAAYAYNAAATAAQSEGDPVAQANAYVHAAAVFQQVEQWDDALSFLTSAEKLVKGSTPSYKERTLRDLRLEIRWVQAQSLDPGKALIWLRDTFSNTGLPAGRAVDFKLRLGRISIRADKHHEAARWFGLASEQAREAGLAATAEFARGLETIYREHPVIDWTALLTSITWLRESGDSGHADNLLGSAMWTQTMRHATMPPQIIDHGAAHAMHTLAEGNQFTDPSARAAHRHNTNLDPYGLALDSAALSGRAGTFADLVDYAICAHSHTEGLLSHRPSGITFRFDAGNGPMTVGPQGAAPEHQAALRSSALPAHPPPALVKGLRQGPVCVQASYEDLVGEPLRSTENAVRLW
ncbi:hypothetical protein [Sinomonas cellulolyticus]|uniref:Uncharacterized protein n=1 Tax=Sinomonas cellulolyticus TaxID=2801916 RepID=A0ABS1JXR4_9MICC|nr:MULTISPECIES: hypothetical protein [Sinomonas]MBL0703973.1 hypothetical protein [Sinomonas cellulolyticus]